MTATDPRASRPLVPGYGIPESEDGMLPWEWARARLDAAIVYWVSTVRPDGRPHAMPTWAAWLDDALWFEGGFSTRRARNLAVDPRVVATVHVNDQTAVIIEGVAELRVDPGPDLEGRLVAAFAKYRTQPEAYEVDPANWRTGSGGGLWALRPTIVFGWSSYPADATRWMLDPGS